VDKAEKDLVPATTGQTSLLALFLILTAGVLAYTFLRLWPDVPSNQTVATFNAIGITFSVEIRMLLLAGDVPPSVEIQRRLS
jgi:hypothetical protein